MVFALALLALPPFASAQIRWEARTVSPGARIAGGIQHPRNSSLSIVWGDGIRQVDWKTGAIRQLAAGQFEAPGCWFDNGLVLIEKPGRMVWIRGSQKRLIDTQAGFADCLATNLLGKRGILVTHRGLQVRFYQPGADGHWPYQEVYSFYTASYQAGLIQADVDGDGRPDLFTGNYWIQSPAGFNLPWRLFAINTYNDQPQSARLRLALIRRSGKTKPSLLVSQGHLAAGRLALFDQTDDVRQLWIDTLLDGALAMPHLIAVADLDADGLEDFVLGETAGGYRLWWWRQLVGGHFTPIEIAQGYEQIGGWSADIDRDGRLDIVTIREGEIRCYRNRSPLQ